MSIGFGIVGTGAIAKQHAQAIAAIPDAEVVACFDTVATRSEEFADTFGGTAYTTSESFLRDTKIDVVNICTPSGAHLDPGLAALDAGRHVIIEKPLEVTPERCDRLIERAQQKGALLAGVFPMRFYDAARALKSAIDNGTFGNLTIATATVKWFRSQEYYDQAKWRGTWQLDGGGALMNQGIHTMDLLQWLAGDVVEVSAYAGTVAHTRIEVEDTVTAALRFANGALGSISCTTASWPGWAKRIELSGIRGSAILEDQHIAKIDIVDADSADLDEALIPHTDTVAHGAGDPNAITFEGHRRQIVDFITAMQTGSRPLVDGPEARKAVAAIAAIYRSAQEGSAQLVR